MKRTNLKDKDNNTLIPNILVDETGKTVGEKTYNKETIDKLLQIEFSTNKKQIGILSDKTPVYLVFIESTVGNINNEISKLNIEKLINIGGMARSNYGFQWYIPNHYPAENGYDTHVSILNNGSPIISFQNYYRETDSLYVMLIYTEKQ